MAGIGYEPSHSVLNELVRFVFDRLDEDYRDLKRAARTESFGVWSEQRSRVELETRREIVGVVQRMAVLRDLPAEAPVRDYAVQLLRSIADIWIDHRDYLPSWRTIALSALPAGDALAQVELLDHV